MEEQKDSRLKIYSESSSQRSMMVQAYKEQVPVEFELKDVPLGRQFTYHTGKEETHRVEFIMWKAYWIVNAEINGVWHTNSFPNHTSMIEFLAIGSMSRAKDWPIGRKYTNE